MVTPKGKNTNRTSLRAVKRTVQIKQNSKETTILQINLNHSRAATAQAAKHIQEEKVDIALIQDPYVTADRLYGFPTTWPQHASKNKQAWVVVANNKLIHSYQTPTQTTATIVISTETEELAIASQYIPPKEDFIPALKEWEQMAENWTPHHLIIGADLNASAPLWGSRTTNERGNYLQQHITTNGLSIANDDDSPPTFQARGKMGWPDVTITNNPHIIKEWEVSKVPSLSDHSYITYKYQGKTKKKITKRYRTKGIRLEPLQEAFSENIGHLRQKISEVSSPEELDNFTTELQSSIVDACHITLKKKSIGKPPTFTWWNSQLRQERNKVNAMSKKYNNMTPEQKQVNKATLNKARAQYRRLIIATKRKAWQDFCTAQEANFGSAYKFAHGKYFAPPKLMAAWGDNYINQQQALENITEYLFPQTGEDVTSKTTNQVTTQQPNGECKVKQHEVHAALFAFNVKKAPGPDGIDFRILRAIFLNSKSLITKWINTCFTFRHFPLPLRIGEVVFFEKKGKDPANPKAYRPICLLPTLGKLLEKIIQKRLVFHLETQHKLSPQQHGFRENKSCETALNTLIQQLQQNRKENLYTSVISLDIQGAFDTIQWSKIKEKLVQTGCPEKIRGLLNTYLSKRKVLINWGDGTKEHNITRGCPQGSCVGPILWLLAAEDLLTAHVQDEQVKLQAYADDIIISIKHKSRRPMEELGRNILSKVENWLTHHKLEISASKCSVTHILPNKKRNWKRPPIYKLKGNTIPTTNTFEYLGVKIARNLNWSAHIQKLDSKIAVSNQQLNKVTKKTWGINSKKLKLWYQVVTLKQLTYAASAWADTITQQNIKHLEKITRPFLIRIAKAYITTPTTALNVLTGTLPIQLELAKESQTSKLLRLNQDVTLNASTHSSALYQKKNRKLYAHPATIIPIPSQHYKDKRTVNVELYTDGSKGPLGVGSAFCAYETEQLTETKKFKLQQENSVYQAELLALGKAVQWIKDKGHKKANIYTDSLSSLNAINSTQQRNTQVQELQQALNTLYKEEIDVKLYWVPAHTGIQGNEKADGLAKEAAIDAEPTLIPYPATHAKNTIAKHALQQWQNVWNEATTGRTLYNHCPKISQQIKSTTPWVTSFLTGHGPFLDYLHRFNKTPTDICVCDKQGTATHYLTECPLTQTWHIKKSTTTNMTLWTKSVMTNKIIQSKLKETYNWLINNTTVIVRTTL